MPAGPLPILVVDDDPIVREAYRKILGAAPAGGSALAQARAALFGAAPADAAATFDVTMVEQGQSAIDVVSARMAQHAPFAMAFVDMRMPPGIDGIATIQGLWRLDPDLQVVLATAYSDVPWHEVRQRLGSSDRLLILKKPFEPVEAQQLAHALGQKRRVIGALRARDADLEQRIAARTRELEQALVAAEAATRTRTQFLANMSHEIRTPLTAILGFTELLRDGGLGEAERLQHVATIERNGSHLLAVLNDVLDLSKLEAGQLLVERIPVDVPTLLRECVELLRAAAADKGLRLELRAAGPFPVRIVSDPVRLRQVLLNLLSNAVKFTAAGGVELAVATVEHPDAGPQLQVAVRDSGIGMTAAQQRQLFQPFAQADASMSRRYGGTGLGLSISRQLAVLLGGDIAVQSAPGAGSTFTLTVAAGPLDGVPLLDGFAAAPGVAAPAAAPRARLHGRVLLAEDGADNQRLISTILARAGADVTVAANGQVAVELAMESRRQGLPFDLILMDMQMPIMDGHVATRHLRALGWQGPIVALTAHAMEGDRDRCLADGCDAYETKPVRADRLVAACRQHLGRP